MKKYKEVKDRETGLKRSVDSAGEDFSDKVKYFTERRGFRTVRSYIRGTRSTAKSEIPVARSEPAKMASFQPYWSKFCRPLGNGIDYRISKHIKRMGAGSSRSTMVKQAGVMVHVPKAAKAVSKASPFLSKAKTFLNKHKMKGVEAVILGNSLYAGKKFKDNGYKANMYQRASFGLAGATLGLGLGRAAAKTVATGAGFQKGIKGFRAVDEKIDDVLRTIKPRASWSSLSKAQRSAINLNKNRAASLEAAFKIAGGKAYTATYKAKKTKYGLIGAGIGGVTWAGATDEARKKNPVFRLL
jgi:hypothetical protein